MKQQMKKYIAPHYDCESVQSSNIIFYRKYKITIDILHK